MSEVKIQAEAGRSFMDCIFFAGSGQRIISPALSANPLYLPAAS